jgi:hypothetical protein
MEEKKQSRDAVRCLSEAIRIKPNDKESHLLLAVRVKPFPPISWSAYLMSHPRLSAVSFIFRSTPWRA